MFDLSPEAKRRLYSARSRAKAKGVPLSPHLQALWDKWQAAKAARKAQNAAKKRDRDKRWRDSRRELLAKRFRERYATDAAFRAKCNAKRIAYYHATKAQRTEAERAEIRAKRLANLAKARAAKPKAAPKAPKPPKPRHVIWRKPGRILANMGWRST